MPGIAHIFLGSLLALLLYNFNSVKFTRKHAFLFAINSYLGPDLAGVIGIGSGYALGHSVLGWPIWCLWMIPVYSFLTRFSLDEKHFQLKDDGYDSRLRLNWLQTYFVVVAGGLFHFTVDITMERKYIWSLGLGENPWDLSIYSFTESLNFIRPEIPVVGIIAIILVIITFFSFNFGMRQADHGKSRLFINSIVVISVIVYIILNFIFGKNNVAGNEPDLGAMMYFSIFIFLPIGLCLLSANPDPREVSQNIIQSESNEQKILSNYIQRPVLKLKLVITFFFGFASIFLLVVIVFAIDRLNNYATLLKGANETITSFVTNNFVYLALGISGIAIIFILVGILLNHRKFISQRLAMILFVISGILIVPLGFWGLLREKEVIELFESQKKADN